LLNAIIVKLMENCPMFPFMRFLSAVGKYQNSQSFSDKWIRLALKCSEASGARACELGNTADVFNTLALVDRASPVDRLRVSRSGAGASGI
jgi:hypothetical protein